MSRFERKGYEDLLNDVFSRHPSVQTNGFRGGAYKPGLERISDFDAAIGSPSKTLKCIHVAGTNGKGSVSHMLASAIAATGMRVGLYTSPHLLDFRERIRMVSDDGYELIEEEEIYDFISSHHDLFNRLDLSFFDITTELAFWWMAREKVDMAVIETGLGGRLDSTNIINAELSVITSIGLDHCPILGSTRSLIAAEKAGIFKAGKPALVATRDRETAPVFERRAAELGCPLTFADEGGTSLPEIIGRMDLKGEYQRQNLRTAVRALDILGLPVNGEALAHAAGRTGLRGRWEILSDSPLTIADIGHNPPALKWNFAQLEKIMKGHDKLIVVYGIMADKALDDIIPMMPDHSDTHYVFVTPRTPRAMDSREIMRRFMDAGEHLASSEACASVHEGIRKARSIATGDSLIYIGGSTFVVCEALERQD